MIKTGLCNKFSSSKIGIIIAVFASMFFVGASNANAKLSLRPFKITRDHPPAPVYSGYNPALQANYAGIAVENKLLSLDYIRLTHYGLVELNAGRFIGDSVTGYQAGFYYPFGAARDVYHVGNTEGADGFYLKLLGGTVDTQANGADKYKASLGAGAGLSYLWLNHEYLGGIGASVAFRKAEETQNGSLKKIEPLLLLSARINFGF